MRSSSEWLLVLPVVALGMASGCCRPSGGGPAAGGPPGVSAREAVLADMKGLQAEPPDAVEGYVSEWGTAGALVVRVAGGQRVVVGDQAGPVYEAVAGVVFSQDGRHVAYVARDHGRVVVVRDGKPGAPFDEIGELLFTRDGQHLVHRGVDDGKAYLVIDGRRGPPAAFDAEPFWSVKQDEVFVVERPASADRLEVAAWSMTLQRRVVAVVEGGVGGVQSQDGTRLAVVVAEGGKQRVVSFALATPDQRVQGQPYDEIGAIHWQGTWAGAATAQEAMQAKACELGADAVIVNRDFVPNTSNATGIMTGTAIKYR